MLGGGSESEPAPSRMAAAPAVATAGPARPHRRPERTTRMQPRTSAGSPAEAARTAHRREPAPKTVRSKASAASTVTFRPGRATVQAGA